MTRVEVISKYRQAIATLKAMGLRQTGFVSKSQRQVRSILAGRRGLAAFDIDPKTKALLSTDENWALAAAIVAGCEDELNMELISPGKDWILELEERAYRVGSTFEKDLHRALGGKIRTGLGGIDATTLKMIRAESFELIKGLRNDQVEYIRTMLTKATIENHTYQSLVNNMIREGKIPALVDSKGRLIEMETRVEMIVQTETGRIAEQGTQDKAVEIYGGEDLYMRWHTIMDGRQRSSHRARNGEVRKLTDWKNVPHSSDGKAITPGQMPRCRCWGEYGLKEDLLKAA